MGPLSGKLRIVANLLLVAVFVAFVIPAGVAKADDDSSTPSTNSGSGSDDGGDTDFARSALVKILL